MVHEFLSIPKELRMNRMTHTCMFYHYIQISKACFH
jgi:hypothetical protein